MSFAALPSEIHHRIAVLTVDDVKVKRPPILLGKTLSLVSKALQIHGQRLVWYCVKIDIAKSTSSLPQVFLDFEHYPHLHELVKEIEVTDGDGELDAEQYDEPMEVIIQLIKHCQTLEDIQITIFDKARASQIRQVFIMASHLKCLRAFALLSRPLVVDKEVIERFHNGFSKTRQLAINLEVTPSLRSMVTQGWPKKKDKSFLEYLALVSPDIHPKQIPYLFLLLAQSFYLFSLAKIDFPTNLFRPQTFRWIQLEPDCLRDVTFDVHPLALVQYLPDLVSWLPRLGHLLRLGINQTVTREVQQDTSLKASVSLARLLAAVPSSMYLLVLKATHFFGPVPYPVKRLKAASLAQLEGPVVRCYLDENASMNLVTLKKMKDPKGILRWHRIIEVSSLALSSVLRVVVVETELALTLFSVVSQT